MELQSCQRIDWEMIVKSRNTRLIAQRERTEPVRILPRRRFTRARPTFFFHFELRQRANDLEISALALALSGLERQLGSNALRASPDY